MRRHSPNAINYTDYTCRELFGRWNRYVRLGISNRYIFTLTDASSWLTAGSNDTFAAPDCAAESERMSRTKPIITRLSECESTEAEVQYYKVDSSIRRSHFSRHGIPAVKRNYRTIQPQRLGIMPLFTRHSGCDSGIPCNPRHDSSLEAHIVSDKIRMRLSRVRIFEICVKSRHFPFVVIPHPFLSKTISFIPKNYSSSKSATGCSSKDKREGCGIFNPCTHF